LFLIESSHLKSYTAFLSINAFLGEVTALSSAALIKKIQVAHSARGLKRKVHLTESSTFGSFKQGCGSGAQAI